MSDNEFILIIQKRYKIPEHFILKMRKHLGRALLIPYEKVLPDLKIISIKDCWILYHWSNKSSEMINYLIEDLFYLNRIKENEIEKISIETVSEFLYYSAVLDGLIELDKEN